MKASRRSALLTATAATAKGDGTSTFARRMGAVPAMLRDTATGRYAGLGRGRLLAMCLALAYIVAPIDILPEALLTIPGLADDAAIAAWLLAMTSSAADDYLRARRPIPVAAGTQAPVSDIVR